MQNNGFLMKAYTGSEMRFPFWGRLVFDISKIKNSLPMPSLREHVSDRIVGIINKTTKDFDSYLAEGNFFDTPDGRDCYSLIEQNFPMQASVGIWIEEVEEVPKGESVSVNGRSFEGPGFVVRNSNCREISFCTLGADSNTSVENLNLSDNKEYMTLINEHMVRHKCSRLKAMGAVSKKHPNAREAYIQRANPGRRLFLRAAQPQGPEHNASWSLDNLDESNLKCFEDAVAVNLLKGVERGESILKAMKDYPKLHEAYLIRVNENPKHNHLHKVFIACPQKK